MWSWLTGLLGKLLFWRKSPSGEQSGTTSDSKSDSNSEPRYYWQTRWVPENHDPQTAVLAQEVITTIRHSPRIYGIGSGGYVIPLNLLSRILKDWVDMDFTLVPETELTEEEIRNAV